MIAFYTLFKKEVLRFWKVAFQTISAPVLTALLYQLIFSHVMAKHVDMLPGVSYAAFLIPGLIMMNMLQNAFANTASSLIQAKVMGNIVFILLPGIPSYTFLNAYMLAAILRGLMVGLGVYIATFWVGLPLPAHPIWFMMFAILGCGILACLGIIAGLWADKFDQLAAFQNFLIMPLTFLSGVFYSIHSLPDFWFKLSRFNPVFYMVDGFRFSFFAQSDVAIGISFAVVLTSFMFVYALAWRLIHTGYKLHL